MILAAVNFTYFSAFLLALSAVVMVVISLCTEKPDPDMVWWSFIDNNCLSKKIMCQPQTVFEVDTLF